MPDNTKAGNDTSANYGFLNSVNFTNDTVVEIIRTGERYPAEEIDFLDKITKRDVSSPVEEVDFLSDVS